MGATVGSVIAMRDAVSPAAVGVDIGCGMTAVKSSLTVDDMPDDLGRLRSRIEKAIPVGRGSHKEPIDPSAVPGLKERGWFDFWKGFEELVPSVRGRFGRVRSQMGSLVRQSEIVIWSSAGEAGSLVEPAGAGLMTSSPDVPA
jgi:tRNA-splicing ligase RtcB